VAAGDSASGSLKRPQQAEQLSAESEQEQVYVRQVTARIERKTTYESSRLYTTPGGESFPALFTL
jgi:hypothetical protein